ncbi:MAG: hypothetical protein LBF94_04270 [Puniceicoccales bacterium]|jgi:hypothetical protein|nr:hypothetical protein [Puniceicoccales bacterium]
MSVEGFLVEDQAAARDSQETTTKAKFGERDLTVSDAAKPPLPEQPRISPDLELTSHTSVVESDEARNTPDVASTQSRQPVQPPPKVVVYTPGHGFHEQRMESRLAPDFPGDRDPSRYISPRCYRRHLNTELSRMGAPFILGEPFFEGSSGVMWREGEAKISLTQEHLTHSENFRLSCYPSSRVVSPEGSGEQLALFCEVETLWPGAQFGEFIFKAAPKSRYEQISEEERRLLKHIVAQTKILKNELAGLERIPNPTPEVRERINSLQNGLAAIDLSVRGHEWRCAGRLQEIILTACGGIDRLACGSAEANSPNEIGKRILAQYRNQLCQRVSEPVRGTFFQKTHKIVDEAGREGRELNLQGLSGQPLKKAQEDVNTLISSIWALNKAKVVTSFTNQNKISKFPLKDFVEPFVQELRSLPAELGAIAEKEFGALSKEVREELVETFKQAEVTFEDYCAILGKDVEETRTAFLEGIGNREPEDGDEDFAAALQRWILGEEKMSLGNILKNFYGIDSFFDLTLKLAPELTGALSVTTNSMAKLLFPAYLYHIGVLVRSKDVVTTEDPGPNRISQALLSKIASRKAEVEYCIPPEVFTPHPAYVDELYFEAQKGGANSCGICALNHLLGKPIFAAKNLSESQAVYACFTNRASLTSAMKDASAILNELKNLLPGLKDQKKREAVEKMINEALAEIDSAIASVDALADQIEALREGRPIENYADHMRNIDKFFNVSISTITGFMQPPPIEPELLTRAKSSGQAKGALKKSFSPVNGTDTPVITHSLEAQTGVRLHVEGIEQKEIRDGAPEDVSQEKRELLEAIARNDLPRNTDRIIVGQEGHFVCIRKLSTGQWVLLDSERSKPVFLPENSLPKFLSDQPFCEIIYCQSVEDQQRLEDFALRAN